VFVQTSACPSRVPSQSPAFCNTDNPLQPYHTPLSPLVIDTQLIGLCQAEESRGTSHRFHARRDSDDATLPQVLLQLGVRLWRAHQNHKDQCHPRLTFTLRPAQEPLARHSCGPCKQLPSATWPGYESPRIEYEWSAGTRDQQLLRGPQSKS
jgi:hypothetical protein